MSLRLTCEEVEVRLLVDKILAAEASVAIYHSTVTVLVVTLQLTICINTTSAQQLGGQVYTVSTALPVL
jgi:hypothetical protein